jgi:hypothetical protein
MTNGECPYFLHLIEDKVPSHLHDPLHHDLSTGIWPLHHYITLLICHRFIWNKTSWNVQAKIAMGGEAPSDWNRGRLTRRVVDIMSEWDTIGWIYISIQNKLVDQLNWGPGRGEWYQKRKDRFVEIANVLTVVGITNYGKDNLPPKSLIILAKAECFKIMRLWNIRQLFHRTRFGKGGWHNKIECWGLWEEEQQGGIAVECCMKQQVGNEKLPEYIRAHQRRPHVLDHFF